MKTMCVIGISVSVCRLNVWIFSLLSFVNFRSVKLLLHVAWSCWYEVKYLSSLGRTQIAIVKRDADIGKAIADRDAGIFEVDCQKAAMDVSYKTCNKINR